VLDYDTEDAIRRALLTVEDEPGSAASNSNNSEDSARDAVGSSGISSERPSPKYSSQLDWVLPDGYDPETTEAQSMKEELQRLQVLKSYLVLDAKREAAFERITAIASRTFKVPIAIVGLVDLGRQWFMSNRGLDVRETPRKLAFCAHAIQSYTNQLIVPDATKDSRFKDNPLVTGPPDIRFYAGVALVSPEGYRLGTLCIIDRKPWPNGLTDDQLLTLRDLADMTVDALVSRRHRLHTIESPAQMIAYTANDLMQPLTGVQLTLGLLKDDEGLKPRLDPHQHELLDTAAACCDLMVRICQGSLRSTSPAGEASGGRPHNHASASATALSAAGALALPPSVSSSAFPSSLTQLDDLMHNLHLILEPIPKHVPLILKLDPELPKTVVCDDLKLFRSSLNLLNNAARRTLSGSIVFSISKTVASLNGSVKPRSPHHSFKLADEDDDAFVTFECEDSGPDVQRDDYPLLFQPCDPQDGNFFLGLSSVASLISSLSGTYGFRPRGSGTQGSVFWFRVPLVLPTMDQPAFAAKASASSSTVGGMAFVRKDPIIVRHPSSGMVTTLAELSGKRGLTATSLVSDAADGGPGGRSVLRKCGSGTSISSVRAIPLVVDNEQQAEAIHSSCLGMIFDTSVAQHHRRGASDPIPAHDPATAVCQTVETPAASSRDNNVAPKPLTPHSLTASAVVPESGAAAGSRRRVRRALVVDDSIVVRKSLAMALKKVGYEVSQAENGLEGLQKLTESTYDIVLCDFLMPVMDGFDCVKQFRLWEAGHRPTFRQLIIGISAHADNGAAAQGLDAGMDDFIPKPIGIKILNELHESAAVQASAAALDKLDVVNESKRTFPFLGAASQAADTKFHRQESTGSSQDDPIILPPSSICIPAQRISSSFGQRPAPMPASSHTPLRGWGLPSSLPQTGSAVDNTTLMSAPAKKEMACLIATDRPTQTSSEVLANLEARDWKVVIVNDGANALRLLQMRNWDAVLIDSDLSDGAAFMQEFRQWEHDSRVNRQKNTVYVSVADIPSPTDETSIVQAPSGFDYVLHKPVVWKDLKHLLDRDCSMGIVFKMMHD
jgi:CheY-like chemotaxis protein/signal transduction histidine kinase